MYCRERLPRIRKPLKRMQRGRIDRIGMRMRGKRLNGGRDAMRRTRKVMLKW